jgi:2-desacetyl-2-hydroxyethyl bacteriochlorophyllide A dehydrogenase
VTQELLLTGPRTLELHDYEEPPLEPGEVRAEAIVSGISHGTELATYRGTAPFHARRFDLERRLFVAEPAHSPYPTSLGYEWVGAVREAGSDARGFAIGDVVSVPRPHRRTHTFSSREQGRFAADLVPRDLDPETATLLQPTRIALAAVHDARINIGDRVAVFGLGAFGLLAVQLANLAGAGSIDAIDPIEARRALAQLLGADRVLDPSATDVGLEIKSSGGCGADVAIEFSGSYRALHQALRSVRLAGRVVAAGFYQGTAEDLRLGEEWHHNRLTLISSMSAWDCPHRDYPGWDLERLKQTALELLSSGRLDTAPLLSHRIPFERAAEAYELIDRHPEDALRVVLTYR